MFGIKFILFIIAFFSWNMTFALNQKDSRPNVIIILSDDQGYGDFSITGNPILETPALDQLAREGVQFSDFHVSPYCTPTRGQLLSGMDALHNQAMTVGAGRNVMRADITTMPEIFRQNGYKTGIFGKWHLGDNFPNRPMDRGFDKSIWFNGWGLLSEYEYDNDYYRTRYLDSLTPVQSEQYCTDLWFDKAKEWMGEMASQNTPFFVYLPTNAPHGPFLAPQEDFDYYKDKVGQSAAQFFGMIRNIDWNVRELDNWLKAKGLKDNTIVIYLNDNGGTGGVKIYNGGMIGAKGEVYEGGHRSACFMNWPEGNIGSNRIVTTTSEVQDLFPTLMDLLDFKKRPGNILDGISLKAVLVDGKPIEDRMFVVQYGGKDHPQKYFSCVAWNDWRLIGRDELYHIKNDMGQQNNLEDRHPEIVSQMLDFYNDWWKKRKLERENYVPNIIGSDYQEEVMLTSDSWLGKDYVNTQWAVALGEGPINGGVWKIKVEQEGRYSITLSRWPFHLNRSLDVKGINKTVGEYGLLDGRAVPIRTGCISVNEQEPETRHRNGPNARKIELETYLSSSDTTLRAWFKDFQMEDVSPAYYVKVKYVGGN